LIYLDLEVIDLRITATTTATDDKEAVCDAGLV
jgi:hypothetical protein